ncbi:MAG TPA: type II toxin-antitoxin system prevent-host-death family antitoxin [Reyranella sp.]|jgi:prevent-host-death family protein|nr:type II toxin-antitoxin system prevent-host-death family antitoxin [Reyranella sp.]
MDRKINAAAFKARCLALIDEVAETGQPLTVTKRGKAKVQIVAVREKPKTLIGALKGSFEIAGDISGPVFDEGEWDWERKWRKISGGFDDPPARYTGARVDRAGQSKSGKTSPKGVRRRPRRG